MAKVIVTTGWNSPGYNLYGKNFAEGFASYWPANYDMVAYVEESVTLPRGRCRSLWDCPGVGQFIARHKDNPEACGRKQNHLWGRRAIGKPYNFRFDAVKFCRQLFIPSDASARVATSADDIIVWLDGDVVTFKTVPEAFIERTLGNADLCFLGRPKSHSEIGFWACRNNDRGREFMDTLAKTYDSDAVFQLKEWHSAWVFDHVRKEMEARKRDPLQALNLTPNGSDHVWFQSPLREFSDHLKGDTRKRKGVSPERAFHQKRA